jgi:GntR family transcriptional regulator
MARLDLSRTSMMHELRETLGLAIWEDHQRIEATVAEPELATILRVPIGAPLLCITRHFLTADDRTAVVFRSHYRADRYYYTVKIAQGPRGPETPREARSRRGKAARPRSGRANARPDLQAATSDEPGWP